ncbi:MAG: stage II sporulation protein M [Cellulomonadaceae bacterium]|jgi:uncharacterized membrane protein SpoIIM required for sporulation|nr:stage II sporulation protein M [Cellulomonadaceae bacterium]
MDLEAYTGVRTQSWKRLDTLAKKRRCTGPESDELVRLYQDVATDLSVIRSTAPDPAVITRLSDLLSRARTRISGTHEPSWTAVARYAVVTIPAALYRVRWWTLGVAVAFVVIAVLVGWRVATVPEALAAMGTPTQRLDYVHEAFAAYYEPGADFAAMVWTNNAWIAAQSVAFGITGIWPVIVQVINAVNVGAAGGLMAAYGEAGKFFALIAPHGQLELTAIFVAGGAGLKSFWTVVNPGPRRRLVAVAQEGRALITVAVGLAGALLVSGLVEGFVTGSALPWWLKILIGTVALVAFWLYVLVLGKRAVADGETGDLDAERAGAVVPTAA